MSVTVPVLTFAPTGFGGNQKTVICSTSGDGITTVFLQGTDANGKLVIVSHVVVDNTGNNGSVYIEYPGGFRYSIAPYTRKTFPVNAFQAFAIITGSIGSVLCTFTDYDPGFPDEVNQVATGIASGGGASPTGVSRIGSFLWTNNNVQVVWPTGTAAGQLAILCLCMFGDASVDNATGLAGWTLLQRYVTTGAGSGNQGAIVYWKILAAGDITVPPTPGGFSATFGNSIAVVYNGPASISVIGAVARSLGSSLSLTGTKTVGSKGEVIFVADRDSGPISGTGDQGFAYVGGGTVPSGAAWSTHLFDNISDTYTSGSTITLGTFLSSYEEMGYVMQFV